MGTPCWSRMALDCRDAVESIAGSTFWSGATAFVLRCRSHGVDARNMPPSGFLLRGPLPKTRAAARVVPACSPESLATALLSSVLVPPPRAPSTAS